MSAQSKRHNFLIQTEASSGLAPACHRFIAVKLFHTRISLDALSSHGQQGKGWACSGPEERSDVLRAQGKDVTEPGCPCPPVSRVDWSRVLTLPRRTSPGS